MADGFIPPILGDLSHGVARTTDTGGLPPSMLAAIEEVGGLWHAGDYDADAERIIASARANDVRALRLDARDLGMLRELPAIEFLHLRSDGRPHLDPVASLPRLRALVIETGALRGAIDLSAHPRLEWLRIRLSGKGGAENMPRFLAGHARVHDLRLSEVPFTGLAEVAMAFPSVRFMSLFGADRMRRPGDLSAWADTLEGMSMTFTSLRSLEDLQGLRRLAFFGLTGGKLRSVAPLAEMTSLQYLSLLATVPPLQPLAGHPGIRMARLSMPVDEALDTLTSWPSLVALIGEKWIGPGPGVPFLETLPPDHPLRAEWRQATHSSEGLFML